MTPMSPRTSRRILAVVLAACVLVTSCGDDSTDDPRADATTASSAATEATAAAETTSSSSVAPSTDAESFSFTVPAGTGVRIDAGETVDVLPAQLDVRIGDHITIDNQDTRDHVIGPFYVAANDTLDYTFVSAGSFSGACTAHSSGQILVVVSEV